MVGRAFLYIFLKSEYEGKIEIRLIIQYVDCIDQKQLNSFIQVQDTVPENMKIWSED